MKMKTVHTERNLSEDRKKQYLFLSKTMSWSLYVWMWGLSVSLREAKSGTIEDNRRNKY